jgi:hypothetical protein
VSGAERVALIAFDDGSSIAVTPEGFFDSSSAEAEDHLNVRIGDRVFGISSFRENFYRPDLVKLGLAGQPLAQFGGIDTVKLSPIVELVDLPPSTSDPTLKVTLRLTDGGGGVGPVRVFWRGTVIIEDSKTPQSANSLTRSYTVPLFNGLNEVRATASNADGSMWSDVSGSVTANLPVTTARRGALHAVVVGIQDFPKRPDRRLTYPNADAQLVADTLTRNSAALFEKLDIKLLTTPTETDKDHVIQALKAMQSAVGPDDEFVFYVASHGVVENGEYYLITSNVGSADPRGLKAEAISGKELSGLLANIPVTKKLVIIDTCDAQAAGDAMRTALSTRGLSARAAVTIISRDFGLTVLAATATDQEAIEGGYKDHGLFTWVVADGLAGKAADVENGVVSSFLLADYVETEVPQLAQILYKREQQPTTNKSGQPFSITKVK